MNFTFFKLQFILQFIPFLRSEGVGEQHPIYEFLFGFEEEGYVFYPISHRDYFFYIVGLTLILFLLLVFIFILNVKGRKRLSRQNKMLKEASAQIQASIHYASQIQQALLPDLKEAKSYFSSYGVFYKPRDVVSGDFYWFAKREDELFVVAMDCTGHGVPGAFLTLLVYQEIRKIIFEKKISSPSQILTELQTEFSAIIRREGDELSDGAEVGICRIDAQTKTLTFSGAKMDLMHLQNGKLHKWKGSKAWIGHGLNKREHIFDETSLVCAEKDKFFLFSDGFVDQFGGPKNRKFMASQLENMLVAHSDESPAAMVDLLQNAFLQWKGTQAQTDDVLILGFQL
jgi:serine phosphatase RsbU (regulator of sigma subunit)